MKLAIAKNNDYNCFCKDHTKNFIGYKVNFARLHCKALLYSYFLLLDYSRNFLFLGSSVVEQTAVNRSVAGSNPARGAIFCSIKPD